MKKCKIIHINDGTPKELTNGNRFFAEEFEKTETFLAPFLAEGYEVKQIVPVYEPSIQKAGVYSFYIGGITVYMEKEE